jgi:protein-S-isoprenylcysteine O-methyltransferase Ste14
LLYSTLVRQGNWLFRWRGHLPFAFLGLVLLGVAMEPPPAWALHPLWRALCIGLATLSLGLRTLTVGYAAPRTSGRNTRGQIADSLNNTGPYSLVRHPLYVANGCGWLAVALWTGRPWLAATVMAVFVFVYERIMLAEEAYLAEKFGPRYAAWAARTPAVVPRRWRWVPPRHPFAWRRVLRSEYTTLLDLVAALVLVDVAQRYALGRRPWLDRPAALAFLGALGVYLLLWTVKHATRWLDDPAPSEARHRGARARV